MRFGVCASIDDVFKVKNAGYDYIETSLSAVVAMTDEEFEKMQKTVAPRVLLVSEAASDLWANPIGSWQTTMAAKEVYKFLGAEEKLLWYFRDGYHYHKVEDIKMLVNAIQNYRFGTPLDENFFRRPFEEKELIFDWRCEE